MPSSASSISTNTGFASFEKELICSICTEVLYQPLTILNCLHTFCGSCLKEWFSHQNRKASSSRSTTSSTNPYSCPTCRAEVIDVQHNATVSNLLELFLAANPERNRSQEDKDDMDKLYKPDGTRPRDKLLPRVERRRERKTRREDSNTSREERLVEEVRLRSLTEFDQQLASSTSLVPPQHDRARSASNEREERRQRRRDRERQRESNDQRTADQSPPTSSPRHPDAIELRQREHRMSHQASLRSMVSAGDMTGTGTGDSIDEARIMQEIIEEGLLGDIDVDALTEEEQDRLAERIAELYRQRHNVRPAETSFPTRSPDSSHLSAHQDNRYRHRSSSGRRSTADDQANAGFRARSNSARPQPMPPTSITRSNSHGSSSVTFHHRCRTSEHARLEQPNNRSRQSSQSREATNPPSSVSPQLIDDYDRRPSTKQARTNTDPAVSSPHASQTWSQMGTEMPKLQQRSSTTPAQATREDGELSHSTTQQDNHSAAHDGESLPELATFEEPSVTCFRCGQSGLEYKVHRHCSSCSVDLCVRCYRQGRGCHHWLGFRHAAAAEYERRREKGQILQPSHNLISRKYAPPPASAVMQIPAHEFSSTTTLTTSNPMDRLQEGCFCDRCFTFANNQCWLCDICNEGDWAFCKQCVQTHHCCTHPLLPMAYHTVSEMHQQHVTGLADTRLSPSPTPKSRQVSSPATPPQPFKESGYYDYLSINVNCDMCHEIIFPSSLRHHCPSHVTDYDICMPCYASYLAHLRMRRDPMAELTAGWRKCPQGHRMIILAFENDVHEDGSVDNGNGVRRIVKADLVGGWKMTDQDQLLWNQRHGLQSTTLPSAAATTRGKWSWKDDQSGPKRTRNRAATLSESQFPPDGGNGQRAVVGRHPYWPDDGADGEGELHLPIAADIAEVEDINGDWWDGVYAGDVGVFPSNYVSLPP